MLFISTDAMMDFFRTYKDMFGPFSIQECVFSLAVFINPVCFPPKETKNVKMLPFTRSWFHDYAE